MRTFILFSLTTLLGGCYPYLPAGSMPGSDDKPTLPGDPTEPGTEPTGPGTTDTTDTTGTTGTTEEKLPPEIHEITFVERPSFVDIEVHYARGSAQVEEGTLELAVGDNALTLDIPGDLDDFDDGVMVYTVPRERVGDCTAGGADDVQAEIVDKRGRSSGVASETMVTEGVGIVMDEVGDSVLDVGTLVPGDMLCGHLSSLSNDGLYWTGEQDLLLFSPGGSGVLDIRLEWDMVADIDLFLLDDQGQTLDAGVTISDAPPEIVSDSVSASRDYVVLVWGWSGQTGDYTLYVE